MNDSETLTFEYKFALLQHQNTLQSMRTPTEFYEYLMKRGKPAR